MFLDQVALVLGLQVDAPFDREFELLAGLLEDLDRIGVVNALEWRVDEAFESRDGGLLDALGEEGHVVRALLEHGLEDELEQFLGDARVLFEIGKGDLGFDHPELGQVPRRVRVFGAEGRAKGVDLAQGQAIAFDVELARHGQECVLAEEIAAHVDRALVGARQVHQVEGRNAEHLAGTFGIRGGDDRRVDPAVAVLVEVAMDGRGQGVAHARDRTEQVGARSQVGDLAQEFERMRLGLDRIGFRIFDPADHFDRTGLQFETLALALRGDQFAAGNHGTAGREAQHFVGIVGEGVGRDHLDWIEAGTVAQVDEGQTGLGIATGAHPAADADRGTGGQGATQGVFDTDDGHA